MKQTLALALVTALLAIPVARGASVQEALEFPQASPPALVRDQFGLTTVEIEYARPSVRERTIFGGLVPYGEVWRTGANNATKVTFSTEVVFGGTSVPPGSYALFTIPGKAEWTVILNQVVGQWGSYAYDVKQDVARVTVKPGALRDPVETLTIGLAHLRADSADLAITWDTVRVAVPVETDIVTMLVPKIEAAMAADGDQKPYLAAAMFYYDHDVDIAKARTWIEAADAEQPDKVWIVYRKGLVLEKAGDKAGALAAAKRASELAKKAGGPLGAEYGRLSDALVAKLK
jgi:hypothetical protein